MALIIIKCLKSSANRKFVIVNCRQAFYKIARCSYYSRQPYSFTDQLHAERVKRWKLLAKLLDLPEENSRKIVSKIKGVQSMSESNFRKMAVVLKELQIVPEKLIEFPEILGHPPDRIEQRYYCLKELGIQPINAPEILRYPTLIKRNAYDLKGMRLLPSSIDPLDHLLSQLPFLKLEFLAKYPNIRSMPLVYIRKVVLHAVLSQKLKCRMFEVVRLLETYPTLNRRSICFLLATINTLLDTFKFSTGTLISKGYLLSIRPSNVEKIISNFPYLGGQAIESFIQIHPKILLLPAEQLLETSEYLKQVGMSDTQIENCGEIVSLQPARIQEQLNEIFTKWPANDLKMHPKILSIVYRLQTTKQKLELRGFNHTSSELFSLVDKDLKLKKRRIGDIYTNKENISHLAEQFNREVICIRKELMKHPRFYMFQLRNSRSVLDYLLREGFTKLQIENALHLVLYTVDTVKSNLEVLPQHKDIELFGDWKAHPYILQLMLYEIERNMLFTEKCDKQVRKAQFSTRSGTSSSRAVDQSGNHTSLNCWTVDENQLFLE